MFLFCFVLLGQFNNASAAETTATTTSATSTIQSRDEVEKIVKSYFADLPVMIDIARCESNFRQFTDAGAVMHGGAGGVYIGIFQFHELSHKKAAATLGMDLATVDGNIAYARHLYKLSGTQPWVSCVPVTVTKPVDNASYQSLQIELLTKLLGLLQQLLALKLAEQSR